MSKSIDLRTVKYFYEERGDPTRYCDWDLTALKEQCPELAYAYEQMTVTRKIFELVLEKKAEEQSCELENE